MADEPNPPVPNPSTEHAEQLRRQRAEQQRRQRILQLDEQIAETQGRVQQNRVRLEASINHLSLIEAERAELVAQAPADSEVEQ